MKKKNIAVRFIHTLRVILSFVGFHDHRDDVLVLLNEIDREKKINNIMPIGSSKSTEKLNP